MFLVAGGRPEACWFFFDLKRNAIVKNIYRKQSFKAEFQVREVAGGGSDRISEAKQSLCCQGQLVR
jgi:hypothetical protein